MRDLLLRSLLFVFSVFEMREIMLVVADDDCPSCRKCFGCEAVMVKLDVRKWSSVFLFFGIMR